MSKCFVNKALFHVWLELWELREEDLPCHRLTCALCHRVEAAASAETPCEISSQVISSLCCKRVHSVTSPLRGLQRLSQSTERKGKQNSKGAKVFLLYLSSGVLMWKQKDSQIKRHLGVIFSVMQGRGARGGGQLSWAIWLWGQTRFGRCQRLMILLLWKKIF